MPGLRRKAIGLLHFLATSTKLAAVGWPSSKSKATNQGDHFARPSMRTKSAEPVVAREKALEKPIEVEDDFDEYVQNRGPFTMLTFRLMLTFGIRLSLSFACLKRTLMHATGSFRCNKLNFFTSFI